MGSQMAGEQAVKTASGMQQKSPLQTQLVPQPVHKRTHAQHTGERSPIDHALPLHRQACGAHQQPLQLPHKSLKERQGRQARRHGGLVPGSWIHYASKLGQRGAGCDGSIHGGAHSEAAPLPPLPRLAAEQQAHPCLRRWSPRCLYLVPTSAFTVMSWFPVFIVLTCTVMTSCPEAGGALEAI